MKTRKRGGGSRSRSRAVGGPLRDRILVAAMALFRVEGVEAVTIRRVASTVGISPMAIYRHYEDRDDLLGALVDTAFAGFERSLESAARSGDPLKRLYALAQAYLEFALRKPDEFALMFLAHRPSDDPFLADYKARRSPSLELLRSTVEEAMRLRLLKPSDSLETSVGVWAHLHGLVALYMAGRFGRGEQLFRQLYARSFERLIVGLKA